MTQSDYYWVAVDANTNVRTLIANLEKQKTGGTHLFESINETDPTGKDAKQKGAKLDSGKPAVYRGLLDYFPRACLAVAQVSTTGAAKYSWKGWEGVPNGIARYSDALGRHLLAQPIEGEIDQQTQLLHKAQVAWNALAVLELYLREKDAVHN
jgi:hypothetical protein